MTLLNEDTYYTALDLKDKLKDCNMFVKFVKMNNEKRIMHCDFKPRSRYFNPHTMKWQKIRKHRDKTNLEVSNFLSVYDKKKHGFRKINLKTLYYLRVNREKYLVKPINSETPQVEVEILP